MGDYEDRYDREYYRHGRNDDEWKWRLLMAAIDDLNLAVEANTAATNAAVAAFAAADNSAAIEAAVTALDANNTALEALAPAPAPTPAP